MSFENVKTENSSYDKTEQHESVTINILAEIVSNIIIQELESILNENAQTKFGIGKVQSNQ